MTEQMTAEPAPPTLVQKLAAEAIGTAFLVLIGCGAAVATGADVVATGLAFGITIVMMAYTFGRVSGGHFNPAVTVGAALAGRIAWKDTPLYAAAQVVGGLVGGVVLMVIVLAGDLGWDFGEPLGSNGWGDSGNIELFGALILEIVLTFVFVFVIVGVTDERNDTVAFAPLVIGLALAAVHFVGINFTGTSVNPARSIGVAWFSGSDALIALWVFIVAPLIGGAAAGFLYPLLFGHGATPIPGSGIPSGGATATVPGFGAPDAFQQQWNQPVADQGGYAAPAPAEQPIIQDGWQWDPSTQQWIPAQQPPAPQAPQAEQPGGWAPPGGEHTQVRPPDA
ncbi:MIP family channel protein [Nocardioides immobilis]|uniref:MIP family channel protein n=1 Tax=Nocardioides immobilis TaxID=2049295 RepID=A0A417Y8T2_9ACTN|nr:aquaporin [Nocardioides immobilis]RHW28854.1 MIP family channel protein [Nocardioides immobilis]